MAAVKLTKGELKRKRDELRQYHRYLPTLHLKKKQLQLEIHRQVALTKERLEKKAAKDADAKAWAGLLSDTAVDMRQFLAPRRVAVDVRNVAGVDIPVFRGVAFDVADYDLFVTPAWVDHALDALREIVALTEEVLVLERGLAALQAELRTTAQRVNLFEKVKIPQAGDAIRRIKISIGDQMVNAVGRSKIAKAKIEQTIAAETAA